MDILKQIVPYGLEEKFKSESLLCVVSLMKNQDYQNLSKNFLAQRR